MSSIFIFLYVPTSQTYKTNPDILQQILRKTSSYSTIENNVILVRSELLSRHIAINILKDVQQISWPGNKREAAWFSFIICRRLLTNSWLLDKRLRASISFYIYFPYLTDQVGFPSFFFAEVHLQEEKETFWIVFYSNDHIY